MSSPASIAKHPFHPMLIPFPIGWWVLSLICDIIALVQGDPIWSTFAGFTMVAGVIAALVAALPGAIDLFTMQPSRAKSIGIWHMSINLLVTIMYIVNFFWRQTYPVTIGQFVLSIVAVLLLVVSGWLGGEMVYVYGAAVDAAEKK